MGFQKQGPDASADRDIECLECGVRLHDDEVIDVGGDALCEQCAEEHLDDDDLSGQPASVDEVPPLRGWNYH